MDLRVSGIRFRATDGNLSTIRMGEILTQRMTGGLRGKVRETDERPLLLKDMFGMRHSQDLQVSKLSGIATSAALIMPEMIRIRPGTFEMGSLMSADEMPVRTVNMTRPYAIGKYPVTVEEYRAVKAFSGSGRASEQLTDTANDKFPVVKVSWTDAMKYCEWLTKGNGEGRIFRLPTEAEWEYAARGCRNFVYPWGNDPVAENAVFGGKGGLERVGSRPENKSPFGVMDMSGNVLEWTIEAAYNYDPDITENPGTPITINPKDEVKVLRGGSWKYTGFDMLRSSFRFEYCQTRRADDIGFRIVEELPQ